MKVIFLDIDGVLNCDRTPNPRDLPYIVDRRLLRRFKSLVARTGAKVVLSSTWRVDPIGLYAARYWAIPFRDVCPDWPGRPRRDEIQGWLKRHRVVTRFAVIDDEDDELDDLPLFQPTSAEGISSAIVRGVERYLSGKTDATMRKSALVRLSENVEGLFKRNKS
jgi:HAD domain in Swiss Army Knife RNA repair proteins